MQGAGVLNTPTLHVPCLCPAVVCPARCAWRAWRVALCVYTKMAVALMRLRTKPQINAGRPKVKNRAIHQGRPRLHIKPIKTTELPCAVGYFPAWCATTHRSLGSSHRQ